MEQVNQNEQTLRWGGKRRVVFSAVGAVLLIGLLIAVSLIYLGRDSPAVDRAISSYQKATTAGDYDQAYGALKAAEGQVTKDKKAAYYADLAAAAANAGKVDEAIDYLKLKHALDPTTVGPDGLITGTLYEQSGDKAAALIHYKAGLEYYQSLPSTMNNDFVKGSLEAAIANLEGEQL